MTSTHTTATARKTKDLKFGSSLSFTITHSEGRVVYISIYLLMCASSSVGAQSLRLPRRSRRYANISAFSTRALQMLEKNQMNITT